MKNPERPEQPERRESSEHSENPQSPARKEDPVSSRRLPSDVIRKSIGVDIEAAIQGVKSPQAAQHLKAALESLNRAKTAEDAG